MTLGDILSMALMNLWRRKLRAVLTVLGMSIGTTSIVVMVSLGIGMNKGYMESLESMGSLTKITVRQSYGYGGGSSGKMEKLSQKTVRDIKALDGVKAVTPVMGTNSSAYIKSGKYMTYAQLLGIDLTTASEFGIEIVEGKLCGRGSKDKPEVVMFQDIGQSFMNASNYSQAVDAQGNPRVKPMDSKMQLTFDYQNISNQPVITLPGQPAPKKGKLYDLKVTGTAGPMQDYYNFAFMDINTYKQLQRENKDFMYIDRNAGEYSEIWVKALDVDSVTELSKQIKDMGYDTYSLQDVLTSVQEQSKQIQAMLGAIGAVSMLVAAIGIANTMMMSIYERTKEIGVIKVLGCKMGNILSLFLCEAAYIGLFGGAAGLGLSFLMRAVLNQFLMSMNLQSIIPVWLALGAVAFSAAIAMISGLYPAVRAMRLSPLAAIRSE